MTEQMSQNNGIYETMRRRLRDAREGQKTAEQELRDLHHILDTSEVL